MTYRLGCEPAIAALLEEIAAKLRDESNADEIVIRIDPANDPHRAVNVYFDDIAVSILHERWARK